MISSLIGILIGALFGAVILYFSVKIAAGDQARDATFWRAFGVNIALLVSGIVLNHIPIIGALLALIATFWIVMYAYKIGFLRSLLVWIVYLFIMGGLTFLVLAPLGLMAAIL